MHSVNDHAIKIGLVRRVLTGTALVFLFAAYINLFLVIPQFVQTFTSFGVALPSMTIFVISNYQYFIVIPLLAAAPAMIVVFSSSLSRVYGIRCIRLADLLILAGLVGLLLIAISMYAPIYTMGEVI